MVWPAVQGRKLSLKFHSCFTFLSISELVFSLLVLLEVSHSKQVLIKNLFCKLSDIQIVQESTLCLIW